MADNNTSLINLGDLSKPATVLIEKISEAIGGVFKPYQIRRVAEAEAQAKKIEAVAEIKIKDLQQRALRRFLAEETIKQNNMENIIRKALPYLKADAKPQNIENDWITNFFDKSKLISDEQMQVLWAKILSGEGNTPGIFSKRTINLMASLDKTDALLFEKICNFVWQIGGPIPLIYDSQGEIYTKNGVNFSTLKHLDSIGLISFEGLAGYKNLGLGKTVTVSYQGQNVTIEFPKEKENEIDIGLTLFTNTGRELSTICEVKRVEGLAEYVVKRWKGQGITEHNPKQDIEVSVQ